MSYMEFFKEYGLPLTLVFILLVDRYFLDKRRNREYDKIVDKVNELENFIRVDLMRLNVRQGEIITENTNIIQRCDRVRK